MILFRNNVFWVGRKNILLIVLIMSFSCMACNSDDDVIRTVTNIEGTVWYDSDSRLWFIQVKSKAFEYFFLETSILLKRII